MKIKLYQLILAIFSYIWLISCVWLFSADFFDFVDKYYGIIGYCIFYLLYAVLGFIWMVWYLELEMKNNEEY